MYLASPGKPNGTNRPLIGSRISYQAFVVCHKAVNSQPVFTKLVALDVNLVLLVTTLNL